MSQNIYDNPEFFAGYATLDRSVKGLDGAPEWPTIQAMLPALQGKNILDLGCGYGWFCRYARDNHAASVVGLDISQKMLTRVMASSISVKILKRLPCHRIPLTWFTARLPCTICAI